MPKETRYPALCCASYAVVNKLKYDWVPYQNSGPDCNSLGIQAFSFQTSRTAEFCYLKKAAFYL